MKYLLDAWTAVHFAFWFVVGANYQWHEVPVKYALPITITGALLWELIELNLEKYNLVTGTEHPINRWISDPAMAFAGVAAGFYWVS